MRQTWMRRGIRLGCGLAVVLLTAVSTLSVLLFATPAPLAHAAGDTLALTLTNGASFTYGGATPTFTAVVTFETKPAANYGWIVYVTIQDGETFSDSRPAASADGMTLTFTRLKPSNPVAVGQRTATARFLNPGTGVTVYSPAVSFTVNRATVEFVCTIGAYGGGTVLVGVGKPINIHMTPSSGGGQLPAEWLTGTYTITLDGPTHVTYSNLTVNNDFVVTVTAPAQNGLYKLTCAFNGSASYAPLTTTYTHPYTFSLLRGLGTVQLFSNPTTLAAGQPIDFYVAFHPASGLPMPTGQFSLWFGNYYTNAFTLGPSGAFLIHVSPLPSLAEVKDIQVFYMGDVNYNQATVHFPLTNQPIPSDANAGGSGGSSGVANGGNNPNAQATTTGTATTTETPGDETTTPTAISAGGALTSPPTDSGSNAGLIVALIVVLLLAGAGGAVAFVIYRMRRAGGASALASDGAQASYGYPSTGYGQAGQHGEYEDFRQSGQYRDYDRTGQTGSYRGSGDYGQRGQRGRSRGYGDETYYSPDDW